MNSSISNNAVIGKYKMMFFSGKHPSLEVPVMEEFLHEFHIAETGVEGFDGLAVFLDLPVLGCVESAVGDETPYLIKFACIQPDSVVAADVDDDAGNLFEIPPYHELAACGAGGVSLLAGKRRAYEFVRDGIVAIDIPFRCQIPEFIRAQPDTGALGTHLDFVAAEPVPFERDLAAGARHGCFCFGEIFSCSTERTLTHAAAVMFSAMMTFLLLLAHQSIPPHQISNTVRNVVVMHRSGCRPTILSNFLIISAILLYIINLR